MAVPRSLTRREAFQRVFRQGQRAWAEGVQLRAIATGQPTRLGIVIRTSAIRHATRRNRLRRLLKEAWRALAPELVDGFDVVIIPPGEVAVDHRDFVIALLARGLKKLDIYIGTPPPWPEGLGPNPLYVPDTARPPLGRKGRRPG